MFLFCPLRGATRGFGGVMPSRREMFARDRRRSSKARKDTHRADRERAQQQSQVLYKLWTQAKAEAKAKA